MKALEQWLETLAVSGTPSIDECVEQLGPMFEWLYEFSTTAQDPEWHAEGNVHIHTGMVLDQLYQLLQNEASHIKGWQRQALILGALLHDIGKPKRTREMEIGGIMRIASPQHEAIGRSYLTFKLMELPLPYKVVWTVLGLVGEHHMPKRLVVKNQAKAAYLALSRRANLELLYWLEVADMRGRTCTDLQKQLNILEEFKMFAEEYAIWNKAHNVHQLEAKLQLESVQAQPFITAHALQYLENGEIVMAEEALGKCFEHKNEYSHLVVLCGPSGIGKSSWVERYCKGYEIVSLDLIREEIHGDRRKQDNIGRILHIAKDRLKEALRQKRNVVWDATNVRSEFRKIVCDFGRDYHALVTMAVFVAPESLIFKGNANREYNVPVDVLVKQLEDYEFPLVNEAHQYQVIGPGQEILFRSGFYKDNLEVHYG